MNSLLLDTNVVLDVCSMGFWRQFTEKNKVYVASTIYEVEALYYYDDQQRKVPIDWESEFRKLELVKVQADTSEINDLTNRFDLPLARSLDAGELECLAILEKQEGLIFCTADGAAIKALVLLGLESRGMSLERALTECGLQRYLPDKHSKRRFKWYVKEGQLMRTTGQGLR